MAQEAVRRDELVDQFTIFKSVSLAFGDANLDPSWVVQVPIPARPISRMTCDLSVHVTEVETLTYTAVNNTGVAPAALWCRELNCIVGKVAGTGAYIEWRAPYSYETDDGKGGRILTTTTDMKSITSPCQPMSTTTWFRPERDIRVMTLDLVDVATSMVPFTIAAPGGAAGAVSVRVLAHFTFFGPRDTRMYM